ncbi:hypothetical protein Pla123a_13560 [Posidoniimonas polymericola]|uniref:DUF1559 domain-containing protein n=1 Tax=Posidoniimonas polymericola TaxID=2528002 RepID=A0A5C5YVB0_9BACT|nr:DUF1559 domain-containing protein [Posidoniimonas polymericola]TWT78563.1 hypothetical protein Pla123a_13560 [Posidoniimonas polymericola]
MKPRGYRSAHSAFTLVELLVVIAIIGTLIALLLPAVQSAREAARRTQCINQLREIGLAVQNHHDTAGYFPTGRDRTDQYGVSWAFRILPFLEEQQIYDARDPSERVDSELNAAAMRTPIEVYACPSRRSADANRDFDNDDAAPQVRNAAVLGDYAANAGLEEDMGMEGNDFRSGKVDRTLAGPIYSGSKVKSRHVTDGLSKTLAVGEKHLPPVEPDWSEERVHYQQGDTCFLAADRIETILRGAEDGLAVTGQETSSQLFGGPHPGVTLFVFLDGHTEALAHSGPRATGVNPNQVDDIRVDEKWEWLAALSTVAGGELIEE